ncbi:hypothetical protein BP6252_11798 [Coleophoma cylindrospora]|uniref:NAD(P)-binding protein n=1 Tax=Coleophoma cylindrospora TaxID=1849047 RepID=A0A3D8QKM8_9HELO|nr:hypothetical protein BP6252_11798 [Coleophoma cylindrospora]
MRAIITQLRPPKPTLTEENVGSLKGKVFIVTGGNQGVGLELVKILYAKGGTVYIAGRSPTRIAAAVETVNSIQTPTPGHVKTLALDLGDLTTTQPCVSAFLAQESRLDVLWLNAAVAQLPAGTTTAQGHEVHMGTNCLGAFLLTKLLLPVLVRTAKTSPKASVRVVFTASGIIDLNGPPGGISLAELAPGHYSQDRAHNYSVSKAGNWILSSEFDKWVRGDGVLCVTQNPGVLKTTGWGVMSWATQLLFSPLMHPPKMGAYTELWTGLSPDVKIEDGGRLATAWGRWHPSPRRDILKSMKTKAEGGTGVAAQFWDWCETQTKPYAGV